MRGLSLCTLSLWGCSGEIDAAAPSGQSQAGAATVNAETDADPGLPLPAAAAEPAVQNIQCTADARLPLGRIRRLSRAGYVQSISSALGYTDAAVNDLPPDPKNAAGFDTDAKSSVINAGFADTAYTYADQAARGHMRELTAANHCIAQETATDACASAFIEESTKRFFRRPSTPDEVAHYQLLLTNWKTEYGAANAARMLLKVWAMSPNFVFRTEIGSGAAGEVKLTSHEIASQLSYILTEAPPDDALLADADAARLLDVSVVESHARRLLETPRARLVLRDFFYQYLQFEKLGDVLRLQQRAAELATELAEDTLSFVEKVAFDKKEGLATLFTAEYSYPSPAVAELYGVAPAVTGETLTQRAGILNQAAFLTAGGNSLHRGLKVRAQLLCSPPPNPPAGAAALAPAREAVPNETEREYVARFDAEANPACTGCHSTFVPIGLAFERYDSEGRYRDTQFGKVIDTSTTLLGLADLDGQVADSAELSAKMASSDLGQLCFAKNFVTYAQGRVAHGATDGCLISAVREAVNQNQTLTEMLIALVRDPSFYSRINVP